MISISPEEGCALLLLLPPCPNRSLVEFELPPPEKGSNTGVPPDTPWTSQSQRLTTTASALFPMIPLMAAAPTAPAAPAPTIHFSSPFPPAEAGASGIELATASADIAPAPLDGSFMSS